jgi:hypothetical protein
MKERLLSVASRYKIYGEKCRTLCCRLLGAMPAAAVIYDSNIGHDASSRLMNGAQGNERIKRLFESKAAACSICINM